MYRYRDIYCGDEKGPQIRYSYLRKQAIVAVKSRVERLVEQDGDEQMTQAEPAERLGLTRSRLNLPMNDSRRGRTSHSDSHTV